MGVVGLLAYGIEDLQAFFIFGFGRANLPQKGMQVPDERSDDFLETRIRCRLHGRQDGRGDILFLADQSCSRNVAVHDVPSGGRRCRM